MYVLQRILIIVLVAVGVGLSTGFMLIISIITNYVFIMGSFAFAFTKPQIREVMKIRRRQINPTTTAT
jgi:hypothetical protein